MLFTTTLQLNSIFIEEMRAMAFHLGYISICMNKYGEVSSHDCMPFGTKKTSKNIAYNIKHGRVNLGYDHYEPLVQWAEHLTSDRFVYKNVDQVIGQVGDAIRRLKLLKIEADIGIIITSTGVRIILPVSKQLLVKRHIGRKAFGIHRLNSIVG